MGRFIAYRHTGADPERLEEILPAVRDAFAQRGEETYCTYFDELEFKSSGMRPRAIMDHAFQKIEELGGLFVVIDGPEKSEGMILEIGFCIARAIPFVVAKKRGVTGTYIPDMTDYNFEYDGIEGLAKGIAALPKE